MKTLKDHKRLSMTLKDWQRLAVISKGPDAPKTKKNCQRQVMTTWKPGFSDSIVVAFIIFQLRYSVIKFASLSSFCLLN